MSVTRTFIILLVLLAAGCAEDASRTTLSPEATARLNAERAVEGIPADVNVPTHVIRFASDFYQNSPAQVSPPDGRLGSGDRVHLMERAGGFSRVRDAQGRVIWIASESLKEIPVDQRVATTQPATSD